jgi:hypothetical protein
MIRGRTIGIQPVAGVEAHRDDRFSMSLEQLQIAVGRACARADGGAWASRCAAGIRAALSFAVANPEAARALIDSRADAAEDVDGENYRELIDSFSSQLAECAPAEERRPQSTDDGLVGSIAGVVSGCLHSDSPERIEELAPYLVYLALLPYVGFEEAWRWSGFAA